MNLATAESTRAKREIAIHADEYEVTPAFKKNARFNDFFKKFAEEALKKNNRIAAGAHKQFELFVQYRPISFKHISEKLATDFKKHLLSNKDLVGSTPAQYFVQFKMAVKKAYKEGIMRDNPIVDVSITSRPAIRKDVLTMEEIIKLNATECRSGEVKRSFLFSCLTGLRLCDIRKLSWANIKNTKEGLLLDLKQSKTSHQVSGNLNADAVRLIGERSEKNSLIFTLPTHPNISRTLLKWAKDAGIHKHVTYHVARHSFGTNLVYYGTDVKTASQLMGHASLTYTTLYLHISDSMKQQAVNNLPSLNADRITDV